jgi:hypothetical protein
LSAIRATESQTTDIWSWFSVDGDKANDKYTVNPCGTAGGCGAGAICLTPADDTQQKVSLGSFRSPPRSDSDGNTVITYTNGDACPSEGAAETPASSEITYKCGTTDGAPFFEGFSSDNNDCLYKFTWETTAACTAGGTKLKCIVEGAVGQFDLTQLQVNSNTDGALNWEVENAAGKAIVINVCANLIEADSWVK